MNISSTEERIVPIVQPDMSRSVRDTRRSFEKKIGDVSYFAQRPF